MKPLAVATSELRLPTPPAKTLSPAIGTEHLLHSTPPHIIRQRPLDGREHFASPLSSKRNTLSAASLPMRHIQGTSSSHELVNAGHMPASRSAAVLHSISHSQKLPSARASSQDGGCCKSSLRRSQASPMRTSASSVGLHSARSNFNWQDVSYLSDQAKVAPSASSWRQAAQIEAKIPPSRIPVQDHCTIRSPLPAPLGSRLHTERDAKSQLWNTTLFPSLVPAGRQEVHFLEQWLDDTLAAFFASHRQPNAGANADAASSPAQRGAATGAAAQPTEPVKLLDVMSGVHQIYSIATHELVRQISANCVERGVLLDKIWSHMTSMVEVLVKTATSAEDRVAEQRKSVESELAAWADAHEALTNELQSIKDERNQLEVQKLAADTERRELESETMRVDRLARELQKANEECVSLQKQLQSMHQLNAAQQTAATTAYEEHKKLKAELAQTKKELRSTLAELEDERGSHEITKQERDQAERKAKNEALGATKALSWPALLSAAEAAGKLRVVARLSKAGREEKERISTLLDLCEPPAPPPAAAAAPAASTKKKAARKGAAAS